MRVLLLLCISLIFFGFCDELKSESGEIGSPESNAVLTSNEIQPLKGDKIHINTNHAAPEEVVSYAESLTGIPYKYGSSDPKKGFDCSGFITYVFNHFEIAVPRSSADFVNVEREIKLKDAKKGDLILFTGTDSTVRAVGHMGIITSKAGRDVNFIHSTSGKAYSVTTTPLNTYYQGRFLKVLRIFK